MDCVRFFQDLPTPVLGLRPTAQHRLHRPHTAEWQVFRPGWTCSQRCGEVIEWSPVITSDHLMRIPNRTLQGNDSAKYSAAQIDSSLATKSSTTHLRNENDSTIQPCKKRYDVWYDMIFFTEAKETTAGWHTCSFRPRVLPSLATLCKAMWMTLCDGTTVTPFAANRTGTEVRLQQKQNSWGPAGLQLHPGLQLLKLYWKHLEALWRRSVLPG